MKYVRGNLKMIFLLPALFILIGFVSHTKSQEVPQWVFGKLPVEADALYAVGMAYIGPNLVMARKKAEDDARVELGKNLSVKVKSVFEKFTVESIDMLNEEAIKSIETTTEVTKSITEATLLNVVIVERYEDEDNNILYALAKMKKETVVAQFKEVFNQDPKKMIQEEKKQIVLKNLDDELEKWDLTQ